MKGTLVHYLETTASIRKAVVSYVYYYLSTTLGGVLESLVRDSYDSAVLR